MISDNDSRLLISLARDFNTLSESIQNSIIHADNLVELSRTGLTGSNSERLACLSLLSRTPPDIVERLLPELLQCYRTIKLHAATEAVILKLPNDWLATNIEAALNPLLDSSDHIDFDFFIQLGAKISKETAKRIAQHALRSSDPDVISLGTEYLDKLSA